MYIISMRMLIFYDEKVVKIEEKKLKFIYNFEPVQMRFNLFTQLNLRTYSCGDRKCHKLRDLLIYF